MKTTETDTFCGAKMFFLSALVKIVHASVKFSFVGTWADVQFTISNTGKFVASAGSISHLDANKSGCKNILRNGSYGLNVI